MTQPTEAPHGSWKSPITSDLIVTDSVGLGQIVLDGEDIYWSEMRPSEGGRLVVVRRTPDEKTTDLTPPGYNARTRVHEYGGGAYTVSGGTVYFSNFADQRLYRQDPGAEPRPLTPEVDLRYADAAVDKQRGVLYCVREDHTVEGREAENTIVSLSVEGDPEGGRVLVSGNNFYAYPRLSPDGKQLTWMTWNHPNMPWDGTELWVAEIQEDGTLAGHSMVAGGQEESIFQPEWSPDGVLHFVSDRTGWWNLYRWRDGQIGALCPMEAEFGEPLWGLGATTYGFEASSKIICAYGQGGIVHLARLDPESKSLQPFEIPYTDLTGLRVGNGKAVFEGGTPTEEWAIVALDLSSGETEVLRRSSTLTIDPGYISVPEPVEFPTENGLTAYGFYYAPKNRDYTAPQGEKPPLIVISHGGPTGATSSVFSPRTQYWTSRGFAVLDVDYGGSTGYGREYRQRLNGNWGVVDVDDCVNGALYLVRRGDVDPNRLAIRGGSAGGYTTLCALTFKDTFRAGASHFGISDLEVFVHDTHKFESRYLDTLVGPFPEKKELYHERSALNYLDRLNCPVIFFQGLEDKVVPPNQAELMVDALRKKGLPVAYLPFEGEQHGFRRAENIKRSLDAELYFYSRIFGFDLADPVEPVQIDNLA